MTGTLTSMIATPTKADQPSRSKSDTNAITIWNTADHKMWAYIKKSGSRLASTLIKFTMSPELCSLRDLLERRRLLRKMAVTTPALARMPATLTSWKYWCRLKVWIADVMNSSATMTKPRSGVPRRASVGAHSHVCTKASRARRICGCTNAITSCTTLKMAAKAKGAPNAEYRVCQKRSLAVDSSG